MEFEWDPHKAASNLLRHGVAFEEALSVFADPLARVHGDPAHSEGEGREIIVGHSNRNRLLLEYSLSSAANRSESLARGAQRIKNDMTTKKTSLKRSSDEMQAEYRFDYKTSRPNRFASRMKGNTVAVVLDPDVASVFTTSASVNRTLRSAIKGRSRKRGSKRKAG